MDMNLKAFMKAELKERGTVEFPGVATFTDNKGNPVPFIIKQLSMKEIKEIRNLYKTTEVFRDKKNGNRPVVENGQVVVRKDYDAERAGLHIMVDAFVQPKLDDPELMEFYKVNDRLDMPETLFADRDDFRYANKCVMEACGLAAKQDEEETVKKNKKLMSGAVQTPDGTDWQYAHILWQKRGLRMEEFAEMPRNVQLAYIASERLANDYPIESSDRLAKVYIKTT